MKLFIKTLCLAAGVIGISLPAYADFTPNRPVEFVVTASPGGGTDIFARTIQAIIGKYKLMDAPVVVTNKGNAGGAEGFVYTATAKGDPYKIVFGTNNAYLLPIRAKVPYKKADLVPVASLAADEFILWVNGKKDFKTASDFIEAVKKDPNLKMGGSQPKDVDQILTSMINNATGSKMAYIPFKSGGEAAVQLAGDHIIGNVNNPSESIGQWQANMVKPLCVFKSERLKNTTKVAGDMAWSDIPTCKESGIPIENYNMPRTVWLPAGVNDDVVSFYANIMKKVSETPEWEKYLADSSQSPAFMQGEQLQKFIDKDESAVSIVLEREGWLAK